MTLVQRLQPDEGVLEDDRFNTHAGGLTRPRSDRWPAPRAGVSSLSGMPGKDVMFITRFCAALAVTSLAACVHTPQPVSSCRAARSTSRWGSSLRRSRRSGLCEATPACYRSTQNYAHQLAARLKLNLADVSCSGATTAHLTGPRGAVPPQLDALTSDTRLVTVAIGGNDLGYIGGLTNASCAGLMAETGIEANCAPMIAPPAEKTYADLAARLDAIAKEIRRRAPQAQLVFVDYLAVLPGTGTCPAATAQRRPGR